jgi:anti-sigma regulatory factor (Ser/Thr protein kinase)
MTAVGEVDGDGPPAESVRPWSGDVLQPFLDSAGIALWTWDLACDEVAWAPSRQGLAGVRLYDGRRASTFERLVHPDDRHRVVAAACTALAGRATVDLEFRLNETAAPDQTGDQSENGDRWLLARGYVHRGADGVPRRMTGILLDITGRALARDEHTRQLHAERRASRRATALQRVAAALSEAATSEQVAAVMVAESLRWLGADAARIELHAADPAHGTGSPPEPDVVRTAGIAHLLRDDGQAGTRIVLPLVSRGLLRGRWVLAWRCDGPPGCARGDWVEPDGTALLQPLATECAQALDRAELYEQQRDIATVLQRTLLPTVLPTVAGAQVAARYQPGGRGVDVGGDWYDVIALPDGRTGLVIGDVEGHCAEAAAVMGQVRNALRAYAVEGSTPAIVMERLNRLLVRLDIGRLVTCCYLEFAAREGTATVVLAGHPPPLVLRPGGRADYVPALPNIVLGAFESAVFVETTVLLDPGDCLLLYTDGLVETPTRALPEGLAALRDRALDRDPEDSADALVEMLVRRTREEVPSQDDVAVLALRYLPVERRLPSPLRAVRRTLPLDPTSASAARRFVTDVLHQWGHQDLSHQLSLLTSELVTNSVLHTSGELELGMYLDVDRLRVEVVDRSERLPALQAPDPNAPGGRGLLIIEALSRAWGVEGRGDGKAVWFEVGLDAVPDP